MKQFNKIIKTAIKDIENDDIVISIEQEDRFIENNKEYIVNLETISVKRAKELEENKKSHPKRMNVRKIFKYSMLLAAYSVVSTFLLTFIGVFSFQLYIFMYGINMVIIWEVFLKPILKEFKVEFK